MKKKQKKALFGEVGSFLMDIAKYVTTGALITTLLNDFQEHNIAIYLLGIISVVASFLGGLYFTKRKETDKKNCPSHLE